jgi:hypothetical protein
MAVKYCENSEGFNPNCFAICVGSPYAPRFPAGLTVAGVAVAVSTGGGVTPD